MGTRLAGVEVRSARATGESSRSIERLVMVVSGYATRDTRTHGFLPSVVTCECDRPDWRALRALLPEAWPPDDPDLMVDPPWDDETSSIRP